MDEDKTDRLWSIHEIQQLVYRYAYAIDSRDWPLLESLWVQTEQPVEPPSVDVHFFKDMPTRFAHIGASTLFVGNHLIEFDGADHARGKVYSLALIDRGEEFVDQAIIYDDIYERHEGRWLFLKRDHLLWWGQEREPNPAKQPAANWPASQAGNGIAFDLIRRS